MKIDNRTMPESIAAEAATLGSMLIDPQTIPQVIEILGNRPEAFYYPENRLIFEAIIHLYEKMYVPQKTKPKIDLNAIVKELESKNRLEESGGINYLVQLARCTKPNQDLLPLLKIIKGKNENNKKNLDYNNHLFRCR